MSIAVWSTLVSGLLIVLHRRRLHPLEPRHLTMSVLDHRSELIPIDLDVEVDTEPSAVTHVRRPEEATRIGFDQHLLEACRSCAPNRHTVIVVMICRGRKLPSIDKPCRFAVAQLFGDAW
jgi:hypothetical protein